LVATGAADYGDRLRFKRGSHAAGRTHPEAPEIHSARAIAGASGWVNNSNG
jgi:hypothetical protein